MTAINEAVFLLVVGNTLLDNDRITADLWDGPSSAAVVAFEYARQ